MIGRPGETELLLARLAEELRSSDPAHRLAAVNRAPNHQGAQRLLISALDDPFIPAETVPRENTGFVTVERWPRGGHLGFIEGPPWRYYAERRAMEFLERSSAAGAR